MRFWVLRGGGGLMCGVDVEGVPFYPLHFGGFFCIFGIVCPLEIETNDACILDPAEVLYECYIQNGIMLHEQSHL